MSEPVNEQLTLSRRLRLAEKRADMTQAKLSRASGLTKTHLSQIENGRNANPSLKTLTSIARALDVSIDFLAGLEDDLTVDRALLVEEADRRLGADDAKLVEALTDMLATKAYTDRFELVRDFMDLLDELDVPTSRSVRPRP